jgi:two-component system cell cycle sensor histidine kinase/response regulator CckA
MNLLIVDDHPTNLKLLRAQLEGEGHTVCEAPDGVEALALLERQPVDAVISDILMPRMDGYRFCHEVRKHNRLRDLPLLIYTATYTSPGDEKLALDVGADKYLTKPASVETIIAALREVITHPHSTPRPEALPEVEVLKEYSERLVAKLEQKNIELQDAHGKLILQAAALSTASNAIIITDQTGKMIWVNEAFTTMTGYTPKEAIGQTPRLLKSGQHDAAFYRDFWKTISSGQTWRGEFTNRRKDGSIYYDEHTVTPARNAEGKITHYIGILHDITARKQAEEALGRSQADLQLALDAARMGQWDWNIVTGQVTWSRHCLALYGLPPDTAVTYEQFLAALHPGDRERVTAELRRAVQEHTSYDLEKRVVWPDGSMHWTASRGQVYYDASGNPLRMTGVTFDITERKRAEEELRRTADLLNAVSTGTSDAVFVKDVAGRYLLFNEAASRFVGRPAAEVIGQDDTMLFDPEEAKQVMAYDRTVRESGRTQTNEERLTAAGVTRTYLATKAPYRDSQGKIIGTIGISRDITERKQAEERLIAAEAKFRHLVEQSLVGIYLIQDGRFVYVSPKMTDILGFSEPELTSRPVLDFIAEADRALVRENVRKRIEGEIDSIHYTLHMLHKGGKTVHVEVHGGRTEYNGHPAVLGTLLDITERKQLEEQLRQSQKMEAVGQLASGVAHDFNNLLVVIQGYTEMLLNQQNLDEHTREQLHLVYTAGERAARLTSQLLTFSRKQTMKAKVLDLNEVVADVAKMLKRVLGENIELHLECAQNLAPIHADTGMMEQVLMNLAVNARDAMPKGGDLSIITGTATVDANHVARQAQARAGEFVLLSVSDTGCGMTPEIMARIFEPFFTTKAIGKGTGLGLATVYGIAQQHNGWVEVESQVGVGTTFKIFFPALHSSAKPAERTTTQAKTQGGSETILVVEDEDAVRELAVIVLEKHGYRVLQAASSEEALAVWKRHSERIRLLLTDMVMPGDLNGWELAQQLLDAQPALKVIYTSGYSDDVAGQVFSLGKKVNFIQKPYQPSKLAQAVRQALDSPTEPPKATVR